MTLNLSRTLRTIAWAIIPAVAVVVTGCATGSNAAKGATQGAATGAMAGAAGGMLTALIFGGDVVEAGARGAVYAGAAGAVSGGMAGAQRDKQVAAQKQAERDREIAQFKAQVGADAFNAVVALADCKHNVALANAAEARDSNNAEFALAGLWMEVLTEADRRNEAAARGRFPELIEQDDALSNDSDAEARMVEALEGIRNLRVEHDLPATCPG
jgi:hypothetical protein